VPKSLSNI